MRLEMRAALVAAEVVRLAPALAVRRVRFDLDAQASQVAFVLADRALGGRHVRLHLRRAAGAGEGEQRGRGRALESETKAHALHHIVKVKASPRRQSVSTC